MTIRHPALEPSPTTPATGTPEQHSLPKTLVLHLLPGALTAAAFYLLGPLVVRAGYPGILAGIIAAAAPGPSKPSCPSGRHRSPGGKH